MTANRMECRNIKRKRFNKNFKHCEVIWKKLTILEII